MLPEDVRRKIEALFPERQDAQAATKVCENVLTETLNVGPIQLIRAMLILSKGDLMMLKEIQDKDYYGDPRDVLLLANNLDGGVSNYGQNAFVF